MKMNGRNNGIIVIGTEVVDFMLGKNINGYIMKEFKGSGSFGSVYSCEKDRKTYAIKVFNFSYVF